MAYRRPANSVDKPIMPAAPQHQVNAAAHLPPRHSAAHALYTDQSWRPCTVLGWCRGTSGGPTPEELAPAWLVHLRFADGSAGWFVCSSRSLRPV